MKKWISVLMVIVLTAIGGVKSDAKDLGYNSLSDTENEVVIAYTEEIGTRYNVCPELLQAIIFYESSNDNSKVNGNHVGYMQVNKYLHRGRAKRLGVDIESEYGNILTGTSYLMELARKYEDVGLVLMIYHGESDAFKESEQGRLSDYATRILNLSYELEKAHGKGVM